MVTEQLTTSSGDDTPQADDVGDEATVAPPSSNKPLRRRRLSNPVVWREVRTRFDSIRTAILILVFMVLFGGAALLSYLALFSVDAGLTNIGQDGLAFFEIIVLVLLIVMFLITMLQASGVISVERDRNTLMPLQITLLRPRQIALGKLRVATNFSFYLVVLSAPILALSWTIGIGSVTNLIKAMLMIGVTVVFAASVTLFFSSVTRRSTIAVLAAFITFTALIVVPTIGYAVMLSVVDRNGERFITPPVDLFATNPVVALADAVGQQPNPSNRDEFGNGVVGGGVFGPGDDVVVNFDENGNPVDEFGNPLNSYGPLSSINNALAESQRVGSFKQIDDPFAGPNFFDGTVPLTAPDVSIAVDVAVDETVASTGPTGEDEMPTFEIDGETYTSEELFLDPDGQPILDEEGQPVLIGEGEVVFFPGSGEPALELPSGEMIPLDSTSFLENSSAAQPAGMSEDDSVRRVIPWIPLWVEYIIFVALICALAMWGTTRRLRTPAMTER